MLKVFYSLLAHKTTESKHKLMAHHSVVCDSASFLQGNFPAVDLMYLLIPDIFPSFLIGEGNKAVTFRDSSGFFEDHGRPEDAAKLLEIPATSCVSKHCTTLLVLNVESCIK